MGCDIHPRIQVKSRYSDDFMTVGVPSDGRWYLFFELLTGQRAYNAFGGVMDADRGLPESLGIKAGYNPELAETFGDHSFTWWTLAEMKAALPKAEAFFREDPDERDTALARFKSWIALGDLLGAQHEAKSDNDVRYVIGYDS